MPPVDLAHRSTLVADVLARALVLTGLEARAGAAQGLADELIRGGEAVGLQHIAVGADRRLSSQADVAEFVRAVQALSTADQPSEPRRPPPALPRSLPRPDELACLTGREREVLALLATGASNAGLASTLRISPHTARTHVQNVLSKLRVDSRLAAVAVARRNGLAPEPAT